MSKLPPALAANQLAKELERQFDAYGKTARAARIHELAVRGATDAELAMARSFDTMLTKLDRARVAQERYARAVDQARQSAGRMLATTVAGSAGVLGKQAAGGVASTAEGVAAVQQLASAIPVVGGVLSSVLGPAITAIFARTDRLNASVNQAMGSIVSGSRTADQALGRIRIDAFASEFQRVTTLAQTRRTGSFTVRQQSEAEILRQLPADMRQAVDFAERAAASLRTALNDPTVRAGLQTIRIGAARQDVRDEMIATQQQTGQAGERMRFLSLGASVEEARDMGAEMARVQALAGQIQRPLESWPDAMARARGELDGVLTLQRQVNHEARQAAAAEQLTLRTRQDQVGNRAQVAGIQLLQRQAQTGELLVEHTQQRVELDDQLNRNAITHVAHAERLAQIMRNERTELARRNAEEVSAAMVRNRRPLEAFRFEQQRLEQMRPEFMARAGGAEQFQRAQARAAEQLFQSVGPLERLGPALTEGSVAAMSAARAAEREARGVDPASQSVALLAALQAQAAAQTIYQRQLVEVFQTVSAQLTPGIIPVGPG